MTLFSLVTGVLFASFLSGLQASPANTPQPPVTLRDAKLTPHLKQQIITQMVETLSGEGGDLRELALGANVIFLKLNPAGPQAIEVDGPDSLCAPNGSGNCPFVLFQQSHGNAIVILDGSGTGLETMKSSHHGMLDIRWAQRIGHSGQIDIEVDHFDGKVYVPAFCYTETEDDNGHIKTTPYHPC